MGKLSSCVGTCTTLSVRKLILTSIWSFLPFKGDGFGVPVNKKQKLISRQCVWERENYGQTTQLCRYMYHTFT